LRRMPRAQSLVAFGIGRHVQSHSGICKSR
jgi:hypothetical protein